MTSQDNTRYVTVEVFNDGMIKINSRLDAIDATLKEMKTEMGQMKTEMSEMKAEIVALDKQVGINLSKIEGLHYFMGLGFAIMAVVIGFVGFMFTLAPMFREMYKDRKREKTGQYIKRSEVATMIEAAVSRALSTRN